MSGGIDTKPDPRGAAQAAEIAAAEEDWHRFREAAQLMLSLAQRRIAKKGGDADD